MHLRDILQKAEAPAGNAFFGPQRAELLFPLGGQMRQLSAAKGFHDPYGQIVLLQQSQLLFTFLKGPVQKVQLDLAELHILPPFLQEAFQAGGTGMGGEAQMPDAAQALLLFEVFDDSPLGVFIHIDAVFANVVQQIKVEVFHTAFFQLGLKNGGRIVGSRRLVAGVLVRQEPAFPGIAAERFANGSFAVAPVVGPGGIKVVDAFAYGGVYHGVQCVLVDGSSLQKGQAHASKPQKRKFAALKLSIDHAISSLQSTAYSMVTRPFSPTETVMPVCIY